MDAILPYVTEIAYIFGGVLVILYAIFAFNKPQYSFEDENEANNYGALARPGLPKYMTESYR